MELRFTPEENAFRAEVRQFLRSEIPQHIRDKVSEGGKFERQDFVTAQRILNAKGWAVPHWPQEWGGQDWSPVQRYILNEELQIAGMAVPLPFNCSMVGPVIATFGNEAQKKRFLPATANLDIWWCQGFSEPDAGSDLASLKTRAVREGDHYIVNGQKTWTTLAQYADWIFCLVRTDPTAPKKQAGISFLLFDVSTPGVTMRPIKLIDGSYEVNEVFFTDVRVPADQLVGEENQGWTYAKFLLGNERTGIAGVTRTKVRLAEIKQRATELGALADPLFAARVAELENDLLALELTQMRVSSDSADGKPNPASSVLKLRGTQLQQAATELALELAGPAGMPFESGEALVSPDWALQAAPTYLNYRKTSIYGGSNEIQRSIIASTILGL